jgi:branched-chain amino acid transport system permease protein
MHWSQIFSDGIREGIGLNAAFYVLAAVGLNVQYGYTGLMNFGQAGFLLVGGYGVAIAVDQWNLPFPVALLIAVLASIGFGLILGIPTLRLRADYLAIVTISAAEILRIVVNSRESQAVTGGPQGLKQFANTFINWNPIPHGHYGIGSIRFSEQDVWVILVTWSLVAVFSFIVWLLIRSPWGRVLRSIREDEDAVRALGKNVVGYKMQSLVLGGVIGGIAGIMVALDRQFVEPVQFEAALTFFLYALLLLGGLARIAGPIVGGIVFWFLISATQTFLTQAVDSHFLGINHLMKPDDVGPVRFMLVGLLIMVLVIFRPQGLFGSRAEAIE